MPRPLQPSVVATDTTRMTPTPEHIAWLACAVLGALLVHLSLVVLATRGRLAVERHDLVIRARQLRAEYWESVAARSEEAAASVDEDDEHDEHDDEAEPEVADAAVEPSAEPEATLRPAA